MVPITRGHPTIGCFDDATTSKINSMFTRNSGEVHRSPNKKFGLPKSTTKNDGLNFGNFPCL